jgi:3-hexulose-6-phosphate synthase
MHLQLALDIISIDGAKDMLRDLADVIDIVEIGTPFIVQDGVGAVRAIRAQYPDLRILADLKIMDGGEYETRLAIEAGASIVTVLALSDDATIRGALAEARRTGAEILVDMIGVADIEGRALELEALGVDYVCVHTGTDVQATGRNPLGDLRRVKKVLSRARVAVAGGIKLATIADIAREGPDIVIVGSGLTGQVERRKTALEMKRIMAQAGARA